MKTALNSSALSVQDESVLIILFSLMSLALWMHFALNCKITCCVSVTDDDIQSLKGLYTWLPEKITPDTRETFGAVIFAMTSSPFCKRLQRPDRPTAGFSSCELSFDREKEVKSKETNWYSDLDRHLDAGGRSDLISALLFLIYLSSFI